MEWFRMYGDMPNDPKIGTLSDAQFRTWVELLCAACKAEKNGSTGLTIDTVNWALRRNVTETLQKLFETNLIALNVDNEIAICAWEKRQYESDSSTERVKRYRAKQAQSQSNQEHTDSSNNETLHKRSSNGVEQNRTEQIQNREEKKKQSTQPSVSLPVWLDQEVWSDWVEHRKAKRAKLTDKAAQLCIADLEKLRGQGYEPRKVIEHCIKNGWTGIFPPKETARASPGYQTAADKAKAVTDALTGRTSNETRLIDIN